MPESSLDSNIMKDGPGRLFVESEIREIGRRYMEEHGIKNETSKEPDVHGWITDPNRKRIIAIDFDGTIVERGSENDPSTFQFMPGALESLNWIFQRFEPILWTCRNGKMLHDALDFLQTNGVYFTHVNANVPDLPFGTSSKIYADFYIDDKAILGKVDWFAIRHHISQLFMCDEPETVIIDIVNRVLNDDM